MKEMLKGGFRSFAISALMGTLVNMIIDIIVNGTGQTGFISMSPDFLAVFPTPVLAAYVNVILYGLIGLTFASMRFVYELERIGFVLQSVIYFLVTSAVCVSITIVLWQLHKYPIGLICALTGYGITHVIIISIEYRRLKKDILLINEQCA